jgi:phosphate starvation-inducible PhoH-like protein
MTTEKTIHFDNAREAHEITGNGASSLTRLGDVFSVAVTARDTWLRLQGEPDQVARAERFIECLRKARGHGRPLKEFGISYALNAFREGREEELEKLYQCRIDVCTGKPPVFPRTFGQYRYVEAILSRDINFGIGPAGTGKTYLAMALAIHNLITNKVSRIILTRPAIEAGEALGFLPGDMHEKVFPYLRPLYDALYDMMSPEEIERNMSRGVIEIAPLAYMRGRTLNHAFVILDEAQNTTNEQMLMFLTRLGFDSRCVVTGDLTQIDLPNHKTSGLVEAAQKLADIPGISFTRFSDTDVVRHPLVQKIIQAYRNGRVPPDPAPVPDPAESPSP